MVDRILAREEPTPTIPLNHTDPFSLLVATVLSAQCTDERVNRTTPLLWKHLGSSPADLARADPDRVREIIRPCGLSPAKSRAIVGLSRLIMERHGGQVPRTLAELEELPGVGHKTASVVASHAFGIPALPVDTHIFRCAHRWGLSNGRTVVQVENDLKALWPPEMWETLHLRIILFARRHCPARGHEANKCPVCSALAADGLPVLP